MTLFRATLRALSIAAALTAPAAAQETDDAASEDASGRPSFKIDLPVPCLADETCIIQSYVDLDMTRRARDFQCRNRTSDGADGTLFRLRDAKTMEAGANVVAVADGLVRGYRNGEPDGAYASGVRDDTGECGNGIIVDNANGWETQYCHLKQGSVGVFRGRTIKAGEVIGKIGMSGATTVPALDFRVRYQGNVIDPFSGRSVFEGCQGTGEGLWKPEALVYAGYQAAVLLNSGFAGGVPTPSGIEAGAYRDFTPSFDGAVLHFYVRTVGVEPGDVEELSIVGPDGRKLATRSDTLATAEEGDRVRTVVLTRPDKGWTSGDYKGQYRLVRDGTELIAHVDTATLGALQ